MDGNKKIIRRVFVLLSIILTIYSCKVYKTSSIALYEADETDSLVVTNDIPKKSFSHSAKDTIRIVKYIVLKDFPTDFDSLPNINETKQIVVKSGNQGIDLKAINKNSVEDGSSLKNNIVHDSVQPNKSKIVNSKLDKKVVLNVSDTTKIIAPKKPDVLIDRSSVDSTLLSRTVKDTSKISKAKLNIVSASQLVSKPDSTHALNLDSIQRLNIQLEAFKRSTKLLADSIAKIKSKSVVNPINPELKLKTDSISLLKNKLQLAKYSTPTSKQVPVVQTITKIVNTPIINTDSIMKLNQELILIKRSNRQLTDSIAKLKTNKVLKSVNTQLKLKTDSISLLKNELETVKKSKVVVKEVPVVESNEKLTNLQKIKNDSIQLLTNKLTIVENQQQQIYDSLKQKSPFLQNVFKGNTSSKMLIKIKSDSIALLKMKSDSLNYLLKKKDVDTNYLQDDSLKMKLKQNEDINKETFKIIQLKSDSILSLRKSINELKRWNLENTDKLSDKIFIQTDTLLLIAYYSSGSLVPIRMNEIMDQLKEYLKSKNVVSVLLAGYTDISGSASINKRFTSKRLDLIRKKMISIGYSTKSIFVQNWGNTYASATVNELDRKVEVYVLVERMKV